MTDAAARPAADERGEASAAAADRRGPWTSSGGAGGSGTPELRRRSTASRGRQRGPAEYGPWSSGASPSCSPPSSGLRSRLRAPISATIAGAQAQAGCGLAAGAASPGGRGTISDRHGVELAVSESGPDDVAANPLLIKDPVGVANKAGPALGARRRGR